jgi:iron-sulfur cluster repair protein YtfE (RIC family)
MSHSHASPPAADRPADQRAAGAVVRHHAQLAEALTKHTERLLSAVERSDPAAERDARLDLLGWLRHDLVPHALAEERVLYPAAAARPAGALLVEGMVDEHRTITGLVDELEAARSPVRSAAAAHALAAVFRTHVTKENELVLPMLVEAEDVSVANLLEGMHALLGKHE